jgi:hypothetical protein
MKSRSAAVAEWAIDLIMAMGYGKIIPWNSDGVLPDRKQ